MVQSDAENAGPGFHVVVNRDLVVSQHRDLHDIADGMDAPLHECECTRQKAVLLTVDGLVVDEIVPVGRGALLARPRLRF